MTTTTAIIIIGIIVTGIAAADATGTAAIATAIAAAGIEGARPPGKPREGWRNAAFPHIERPAFVMAPCGRPLLLRP